MINIDKREIIATLELFIILLCAILFHHKIGSLFVIKTNDRGDKTITYLGQQ